MECQRYAGVAGLIWFICHQVVVRYRRFTIKENDTGKMMVHEKLTKFQLILLMACILVGSGCRKQVTATDMDMTEYGWVLYDEGKFTESNEWFLSAVVRDTTYTDGYNGQGWTFGKLGEIDSSIVRFTKGLAKAYKDTTWEDMKLLMQDPPHDPAIECTAGLTLAHHADNSHGKAVQFGINLLTMVRDTTYEVSKGSPAWQFSRDENINSKHIIWTISSSYFSQGKYTESLDYANRLNLIDSTFDVTVVEGVQKLAMEISRLRTTL
ncbi:MAG TPA: hypothetical protein EYO70_00660 [Candidatus Marinimicrobia bacterium]|nr:hypothetical protein [Candidatus Neomarinimicrobiota bacterium]